MIDHVLEVLNIKYHSCKDSDFKRWINKKTKTKKSWKAYLSVDSKLEDYERGNIHIYTYALK